MVASQIGFASSRPTGAPGDFSASAIPLKMEFAFEL